MTSWLPGPSPACQYIQFTRIMKAHATRLTFELLKEIAPRVGRAALLRGPAKPWRHRQCSVVNLNVLGDLVTNEPATFHRAALAKHPRGLVLCVEQ